MASKVQGLFSKYRYFREHRQKKWFFFRFVLWKVERKKKLILLILLNFIVTGQVEIDLARLGCRNNFCIVFLVVLKLFYQIYIQFTSAI